MSLDYLKELKPIVYGDKNVKVLNLSYENKGELCFREHWHERMELIYLIEGEIIYSVGNENGVAGKGDIIIVPPHKLHKGVCGKSNTSYYVIMFELSDFSHSANVFEQFIEPILNRKTDFSVKTSNVILAENIEEIIKLYFSCNKISPLIMIGSVYKFLGNLLASCSKNSEIYIFNNRFKEVLDFVDANFCSDISSETIAERFGYVESYFCRRFKEITGISPMQYIQILRLEKALKLIKEGKMKINEVASECGFSEQGYFARCFKKRYGISPSKYKE